MTAIAPETHHRGAKNDVPGIRFVSAECECPNCKGWLWSRHLIDGTRLEPSFVAEMVEVEGDIPTVMADYVLTRKQVEAAIEWHERRKAGR